MSEHSLFIFICPSCLEIPLTYLLLSKTTPFLQTSCKCGHNKLLHYLNIPSYLKSISTHKDIIEPIINEHLTCVHHKETKTLFYCNDCKVDYCCNCKNNHNAHNTFLISDKKEMIKCIDMISMYKQKKKEIILYHKNLYEKYINNKENISCMFVFEMFSLLLTHFSYKFL